MVLEPIGSQINEIIYHIFIFTCISRSLQGRDLSLQGRVGIGSSRVGIDSKSGRVGRFKVGSGRSGRTRSLGSVGSRSGSRYD